MVFGTYIDNAALPFGVVLLVGAFLLKTEAALGRILPTGWR